ncbi:MAG: hypothetical protein AABY39_01730 [Nitrospirota bacterium]
MRQYSAIILILIFVVISPFAYTDSFAFERFLKTKEATDSDVKGMFTLILYGYSHAKDVETIAILDKEGDQFIFEPYAREFNYKTKKGVPAEEALDEARRFVSQPISFYRAQLSSILNNKGKTIGYEIRPLYQPFVYGTPDLLDVGYIQKNGKIVAIIKLKSWVEKRLLDDGDEREYKK